MRAEEGNEGGVLGLGLNILLVAKWANTFELYQIYRKWDGWGGVDKRVFIGRNGWLIEKSQSAN